MFTIENPIPIKSVKKIIKQFSTITPYLEKLKICNKFYKNSRAK